MEMWLIFITKTVYLGQYLNAKQKHQFAKLIGNQISHKQLHTLF